MSFVSQSVKLTDGGFDITGELTIKDVTQSVIFHMNPPSGLLKDTRDDLQVIFTGSAEIDRTDFNVEGKRWSRIKEGITSVSNTVSIEISLLGKQFKEKNLANFVRNAQRPPGQINEAYQNGGVEEAIRKFDELVGNEENAINANALRIVGHYLMSQNKISDATALFEKNVRSFPDNSEAYDSLGEAYVRLGKKEEAKSMYEKCLELDPSRTSAKEILRHL